MVEKAELESIYEKEVPKQKLLADYFKKLFSGTPILKKDLLRKRLQVKE